MSPGANRGMTFPSGRHQHRAQGEENIGRFWRDGNISWSENWIVKGKRFNFLGKLKWYVYNRIHSWRAKPNISLDRPPQHITNIPHMAVMMGEDTSRTETHDSRTLTCQLSTLAINNVLRTFQIGGNIRKQNSTVWLWAWTSSSWSDHFQPR